MFLTNEILEKYDACTVGKKWFNRYFPEGAEILDIIKSPKANIAFLHWGFENLTTTEEEREAYWDKLNITNCDRTTIIKSHNVNSSDTVIRSQDVSDSSYIFSSKKVQNSEVIANSTGIENSHNVFESSFIYDSFNIYKGKNISNSDNVYCSTFVVNSHSVFNTDNVSNSFIIFDLATGESSDITDSAFIADSNNLSNCLFCANLTNRSYHIFNKPVTEVQFNLIRKQLIDIIGDFRPSYVKDWGGKTIPIDIPEMQTRALYYSDLSEEFWEWIKTLPGYDPKILYQITFNLNLIDEF